MADNKTKLVPVELLAAFLDHVDAETCTHEETHRGGAIWTICDRCDRKWADDEGGFVPHEDAPAVAAARAAITAALTPTPRLVPDRPSDAEFFAFTVRDLAEKVAYSNGGNISITKAQACAIGQYVHDTSRKLAAIDAAAPPAEAPAEDRFEQYVATLIAKNPDVQKLGERLADWLDEDRFNNIEPILTGIAQRLSAEAPAERGEDEFPQDVAEALDVLETMEGDIDGHTDCTATVIRYIRSLAPRVTGGREDWSIKL